MSNDPNADFKRSYFTMKGAIDAADFHQIARASLNAKAHEFESAGAFIERLAERIGHWREKLPEDSQPSILGLLNNGTSIEVLNLGEDGHSGIVIEGILDGNQCMLFTHQASLQILCYTQKVEEPEDRRMIGFQVGGREFEA